MKLFLLTCAVCALLCGATPSGAEDMHDDHVEQTTESPISDMALLDNKDHMKPMDDMETDQKSQKEAQPHTIADFIIHPLIALKPRQAEAEPNAEGKQAETNTTSSYPWQLFNFNAGQGLGSSVSSLAGWLGNRIQLPGLVDTPVRESTTSTSTTTTTTHRPDIVVRVQQRPSTRKPLIAINNENRPYKKKNPNRVNNNLDDSEEFSDEDDDDFEEDNGNRHRDDDDYSNEDDDDEDFDDDDDEEEEEHDDDDGDEEEEEEEEDNRPVKQQNNNRRRRPRPMNINHNNNNNRRSPNNPRRRFPNNNNNNNNNSQRNRNQKRRRPQESEEEVEQDDDNDDDQEFYYNNHNQKRSQQQQNFIQRGQQSLMNQIRQFTRGQTPAEIGNVMRRPQKTSSKKRRQQATLIINRNGQTIYVAPELLQALQATNNKAQSSNTQPQFQFYQPSTTTTQQKLRPSSTYPQPPLTVPYRRKGQPTQYITIPWSQLGIAPPDQLLSVTEGIQSQPLILNIPQSAINAMQNQRPNKRKQVITTEAVPLLAEASLMDIFKPPRIPPARTPAKVKPNKKYSNAGTPVLIASKPKPGPQRIRPATIVEKAPADATMNEQQSDAANSETAQFIVVGNDEEPGLGRNAYPYYNSYVDFVKRSAHRTGRQLNTDLEGAEIQENGEQHIPVQVIMPEETTNDNKIEETKVEVPTETKVEEAKVAEAQVEAAVETKVENAQVDTTTEAKMQADEVGNKPENME